MTAWTSFVFIEQIHAANDLGSVLDRHVKVLDLEKRQGSVSPFRE